MRQPVTRVALLQGDYDARQSVDAEGFACRDSRQRGLSRQPVGDDPVAALDQPVDAEALDPRQPEEQQPSLIRDASMSPRKERGAYQAVSSPVAPLTLELRRRKRQGPIIIEVMRVIDTDEFVPMAIVQHAGALAVQPDDVGIVRDETERAVATLAEQLLVAAVAEALVAHHQGFVNETAVELDSHGRREGQPRQHAVRVMQHRLAKEISEFSKSGNGRDPGQPE